TGRALAALSNSASPTGFIAGPARNAPRGARTTERVLDHGVETLLAGAPCGRGRRRTHRDRRRHVPGNGFRSPLTTSPLQQFTPSRIGLRDQIGLEMVLRRVPPRRFG